MESESLILNLLIETREEMREGFRAMRAKLEEHDRRFDGYDQEFKFIQHRFNDIERTCAETMGHVREVEKDSEALDDRVSALEAERDKSEKNGSE